MPSEKSIKIVGNLSVKKNFMKDPLKQINLTKGIQMRTEDGIALG